MRQSEILCYHCVYPHALNYCQTRRRPPAYVRGTIAEHRLQCTHCGDAIEAGCGFVYVCGEHALPGETELHQRLCDVASGRKAA